MPVITNPFEVVYNKIPINITPGRIGEQVTYTANYGGAPIILKREKDPDGQDLWCSVPDVNPDLVEGLGNLIQEYINMESKNSSDD